VEAVRRIYLVCLTLAASLLLAWQASPCVLGVVLHSGQWIAIDRHYYRQHCPRPGEIVVFRHDGETYIKRVYACEGETIFLLAEGDRGARTLVQPIRRGFEARVRAAAARTASLTVRRVTVPTGSFYALGDALNNSIDSRDLGPIDMQEIIGRAYVLGGTPPVPDLELQLYHGSGRTAAQMTSGRL
jgi:signal peptidase I